MSVKLYLVVKRDCGACKYFLINTWPSLKGKFTLPVEQVDIQDPKMSLPNEIKEKLVFVPQLFALYPDGRVEIPKNSLTSRASADELAEWASEGPPGYSAQAPDIRELELVVVTYSECAACRMWEMSGDLDKFLKTMSSIVETEHFHVSQQQPDQIALRRRMACSGFAVPGVIAVSKLKWQNPIKENLTSRDVIVAPANPRIPEGVTLLKKWLSYVREDRETMGKSSFIGYLLLMTDPTCHNCRDWKNSGGQDAFLKKFSDVQGFIMCHNGPAPNAVISQVKQVPTFWFISPEQWSSPTPEIMRGPDPRQPDAISPWLKELGNGEVTWTNKDYNPPEFGMATVGRRAIVMSKIRSMARQKLI